MAMLTPDFTTGTSSADASRRVPDPITDLLLGHARELIGTALEVEVQAVMDQLRGAGRDVVRNGYPPKHLVTTALGDVAVQVPRIRSQDGQAVGFALSMIPKYLPRSSSIDAWASFAYLKGISEADVASVLEVTLR